MKRNLKQKSYDYIKNKIVGCDYMPGDFLDEKLLIEEIGASRTPIREAMNKLEQEGLLQILPKKGVVVTDVTLKNIVDIYQLRFLIEVNIFDECIGEIDINTIREFKEEAFSVMNVEQLNEHDDRVHNYFISCYDNEYINNIFENMSSQHSRIRNITATKDTNSIKEVRDEHTAIFDAILDKDFINAKKLLNEHLVKSKNRTINSILKN